MRKVFGHFVEHGRVKVGDFASPPGSPYGAFFIEGPCAKQLKIIASSPEGDEAAFNWEHVSVSTRGRVPLWAEMEFIKRLFFEDHETCFQLHVPVTQHINVHEFCLHIWRPTDRDIPLPPSIMVG